MRSTASALTGCAGEGAVEIDDMQIVETLLREPSRACAAGSALKTVACAMSPRTRRTHSPFFEVDRREKDHGRHFRKLAISARPSVWLFSGWNCVPTILSRATIAVIGPP